MRLHDSFRRAFCGRILLAVLAAAALFGAGRSARADAIDQALLTEGPVVLRYLKGQGYKHVGVLPFRVAKAGKPLSFNVGAMNTNMATRLENALILLDDAQDPVGILRDAGSIAATSKSASYLTLPGRNNLLAGEYPLAWGNSRHKADAFLVGDISLSQDNRRAAVSIKAFDTKGNALKAVHQFSVNTDRSILADCGQSFQVASRGLQPGDDPEKSAADDATKQDSTKPGQPTAPPAQAPEVKLTILYDGNPAPTQDDPVSPGERRVRLARSPGHANTNIANAKEGQKVAFVLENTSPKETYAVVLKVNGQNTLFMEMDDAVNCHKWVLPPAKDGRPTKYVINGFWLKEDGSELLPFRVLSEEESKMKEAEFQNPQQIGLIDFHILKGVQTIVIAGPGTITGAGGPGENTGGASGKTAVGGDKTGTDGKTSATSGSTTASVGTTAEASGPMAFSRRVSFRGLTSREQASQPRTLEELKSLLLQKSNTKWENGKLVADQQKIKSLLKPATSRGLIAGDAPTKAAEGLTRVTFENPEEVFHQSIRYYTPTPDAQKP